MWLFMLAPAFKLKKSMKKKLCAALIFLVLMTFACRKGAKLDPKKEAANLVIETAEPVLSGNSTRINAIVPGYYVALPTLYDSTSKYYPLLISLHGGGQFGNGTTDLPLILKEGVPKLVAEGKFPPSFTVGGQNFSFVIVAPQFSSYSYTPDINAVIEFAKKNYRIDASRVYMTGLSMGATETWNFAVDYPKSVTAMSLMSGVPTAANSFAAKVAASGIPLWAFHNDKDSLFSIDTVKLLVARIDAFKPKIPPILTLGVGGHDSWTAATDPAYKENNMNIYEWMLQYKK
jgi:predicted peptidase